jgi:hypothetical protein
VTNKQTVVCVHVFALTFLLLLFVHQLITGLMRQTCLLFFQKDNLPDAEWTAFVARVSPLLKKVVVFVVFFVCCCCFFFVIRSRLLL